MICLQIAFVFTSLALGQLPSALVPMMGRWGISVKSANAPRDHTVYALSQRKMALHRNIVSHRLGTYTEWCLNYAISKGYLKAWSYDVPYEDATPYILQFPV